MRMMRKLAVREEDLHEMYTQAGGSRTLTHATKMTLRQTTPGTGTKSVGGRRGYPSPGGQKSPTCFFTKSVKLNRTELLVPRVDSKSRDLAI